jgi:uncharacterized caspase-like protein
MKPVPAALRCAVWCCGLLLVFASSAAAHAGGPIARTLSIEGVNETPSWVVRVSVDREDRTYREGSEVIVTVRSEKEGYLYLFDVDVDGEIICLFPNDFQSDNKIPAKKDIVVPDPKDTKFRIRVGAPPGQKFKAGKELVKAYVTLKPLKTLSVSELKGKEVSTLNMKRLVVETMTGETPAGGDPSIEKARQSAQQDKAQQWAEHGVDITTVAAGTDTPQQSNNGKPQRVGLFIGISQFQDKENIRQLTCCHTDAQQMADAMQKYGGLTRTPTLLLNEQATQENIRKAICEDLPNSTRPGDVVILYWSGHGGRCANTDGTEPDGFDEFLVPYDGRLADDPQTVRKSMVLDKMFGRWVQALDGRKVMVILDTCHSGGQIQGATKRALSKNAAEAIAKCSKAVSKDDPGRWTKKYFLDLEMRRAKDIGQKDCAVLASSTAKQVSFERQEHDMSVMTYYLVDAIQKSPGPLSLEQLYERIKDKVPAYVEENFPGTTQTPLLAPRPITPGLYVRP